MPPYVKAGACSTLCHRWMPIRAGDGLFSHVRWPTLWSILLTSETKANYPRIQIRPLLLGTNIARGSLAMGYRMPIRPPGIR
jgi:hypothetical protein